MTERFDRNDPKLPTVEEVSKVTDFKYKEIINCGSLRELFITISHNSNFEELQEEIKCINILLNSKSILRDTKKMLLDDLSIDMSNYQLGRIYQAMIRTDTTDEFMNSAIKSYLLVDFGTEEYVCANNNIAAIYHEKGDYINALKYYHIALNANINNEMKNTILTAIEQINVLMQLNPIK